MKYKIKTTGDELFDRQGVIKVILNDYNQSKTLF